VRIPTLFYFVVCTGFDIAYKDTMTQDRQKSKRRRIVIGTLSSELNDGRKRELHAVDDIRSSIGRTG